MTRVLRLEHRACSLDPFHGPSEGECNGVRFGLRGPCPGRDAGLLGIEEDEVCGVLPWQLDAWWSRNSKRHLPHGWTFVEYDVCPTVLRVGHWQVVFRRSRAAERRLVSDPTPFIELLAPHLPPMGGESFREPSVDAEVAALLTEHGMHVPFRLIKEPA